MAVNNHKKIDWELRIVLDMLIIIRIFGFDYHFFFTLNEKMTIHCKKVFNILNKTICKFMFQTTEKALTYQIGE